MKNEKAANIINEKLIGLIKDLNNWNEISRGYYRYEVAGDEVGFEIFRDRYSVDDEDKTNGRGRLYSYGVYSIYDKPGTFCRDEILVHDATIEDCLDEAYNIMKDALTSYHKDKNALPVKDTVGNNENINIDDSDDELSDYDLVDDWDYMPSFVKMYFLSTDQVDPDDVDYDTNKGTIQLVDFPISKHSTASDVLSPIFDKFFDGETPTVMDLINGFGSGIDECMIDAENSNIILPESEAEDWANSYGWNKEQIKKFKIQSATFLTSAGDHAVVNRYIIEVPLPVPIIPDTEFGDDEGPNNESANINSSESKEEPSNE